MQKLFASVGIEQLENRVLCVNVLDGKIFFYGTQRIAIMADGNLFVEPTYIKGSTHRENNVFIDNAFNAIKQVYQYAAEYPIDQVPDMLILQEVPADDPENVPPADPENDPPADPKNDPPADPKNDPPADPKNDPPADPAKNEKKPAAKKKAPAARKPAAKKSKKK